MEWTEKPLQIEVHESFITQSLIDTLYSFILSLFILHHCFSHYNCFNFLLYFFFLICLKALWFLEKDVAKDTEMNCS